ncbi:MAG: hypothetical protein NC318_01670 [Blautia sp.]|nr:hypothetical protein [Blautia sp.]
MAMDMIRIKVSEGKVSWGIGVGTILLGIVLSILMLWYPSVSAGQERWSYPGVFLFLIFGAGIWMCMNARNRKLIVEDDSLCYTSWFGKKTAFSLDGIGYCRTALERNGGNRNYLNAYDLQGKRLCKLEYHMQNSAAFLQYLLDNGVKVECSADSDLFLRRMTGMSALCYENVQESVNGLFAEIKALVAEWEKQNKKLGAEWKFGMAVYLEEEIAEGKPLWEQKGYDWARHDEAGSDGAVPKTENGDAGHVKTEDSSSHSLPEGLFILIEGYLQKDGQFVIDKRNQAVVVYTEVLCVSKSMQIGEGLRIRFFRSALEELALQLDMASRQLPRNRYHTDTLLMGHELKERL